MAVQKELSDSLNEIAKKGYAYCDEAVFTHNCRVGYDLADQGQHMAIRFLTLTMIHPIHLRACATPSIRGLRAAC